MLIAGAGVAGPVVAFWLAKAGFKVTAVEKASQLYKSGQGRAVTAVLKVRIRKLIQQSQALISRVLHAKLSRRWV